MNYPFYPSPSGPEVCNEYEAYKPKVIHSLSTATHFPVDNSGEFIHRLGDLSTISGDKSLDLWIKISGPLSFRDLSHYTTIHPVDKPVDKRGKNCG
jgi:hypothetical protein